MFSLQFHLCDEFRVFVVSFFPQLCGCAVETFQAFIACEILVITGKYTYTHNLWSALCYTIQNRGRCCHRCHYYNRTNPVSLHRAVAAWNSLLTFSLFVLVRVFPEYIIIFISVQVRYRSQLISLNSSPPPSPPWAISMENGIKLKAVGESERKRCDWDLTWDSTTITMT